MEIIKSGTKALLLTGNIEGTITACEIRGENTLYQFAYFWEGEVKSLWVVESELDCKTNEKQKIGYK